MHKFVNCLTQLRNRIKSGKFLKIYARQSLLASKVIELHLDTSLWELICDFDVKREVQLIIIESVKNISSR